MSVKAKDVKNGDPLGAEVRRGKDTSKRMGRYDGSYTPSEQRLKNQLMKQFTRYGEGVGGNTAAYREAECWCACGRLKSVSNLCAKCAAVTPSADEHEDLATWAAKRQTSEFKPNHATFPVWPSWACRCPRKDEGEHYNECPMVNVVSP